MFALEQSLQREPEGQLDRLAGGAGWSYDNDTSGRGLGCEKCLGIKWKGVIARDAHDRI
jgi:hypothetical protein